MSISDASDAMIADVVDHRRCQIGEGPFWHPLRQQLFWLDIQNATLLSKYQDQDLEWKFDELISALGWIDKTTLLIVSETGFWQFDIQSGEHQVMCSLESEDPLNRANDGRADPYGGFWVGTMSKTVEAGKGAIYRFYRGEVRQLFDRLSIPNSICFSPDGAYAYFTDSLVRKIMRQPLDGHGWPVGQADVFLDFSREPFLPDGSVVDQDGALWNAQWGAGRVVRYLPTGEASNIIKTAGLHSSCPAFGGKDFNTLYITTALEGITNPDADQGKLYRLEGLEFKGLAEHQVLLG